MRRVRQRWEGSGRGEGDGDGGKKGTYVVGLSYFLSREPREVYSEAAPRRPASTQGLRAFHGDYHIACHIVGAPHGPEEEKETQRRGTEEEEEEEDKEDEEDANHIAIYRRARRL